MDVEAIDFKDLRQRATQDLIAQSKEHGTLLNRPLLQIEKQSRKLAEKTRVEEGSLYHAQSVLASRGFDTLRLERLRAKIDLQSIAFELKEAEPDIHTYLQDEHNNTMLTAIEESKKEASSEFEKEYIRSMWNEWEDSKRGILEQLSQRVLSLSGTVPALPSTPVRPALTSSMTSPMHRAGQGATRGSATSMDARMLSYARVVYVLNEARYQKRDHFPILRELRECVKRMEATGGRDMRNIEMNDALSILEAILGESDVAPLERSFESQYQNEISVKLQSTLLNNTKRYLQNQYRTVMEKAIASARQVAQRGGEPGLIPTVRAYLKTKLQQPDWPAMFEEFLDDAPLWPQLYYLLRCGESEGALTLTHKAKQGLATSVFPAALQHYCAHPTSKLPDNVLKELHREYNRSVANSADTFKVALYNIVGRFEVDRDVKAVTPTIEDYLWYKMSMVRIAGDGGDRMPAWAPQFDYSLTQLQESIRHYSDSFNPPGAGPMLYFKVLMMTLQFEEAVDHLAKSALYFADAAHVAIALSYYGILREPSTAEVESAPMLSKTAGGLSRLNFPHLIAKYVQSFAGTDTKEAVGYIMTIADPVLRNTFIKDLVLETRQFTMLLGCIQADGTQKAGYLDKFAVTPEMKNELKKIRELAAVEAEQHGLHDEAIQQYELCGDAARAVGIVNKRLGQFLTSTQSAAREQTRAVAVGVLSRRDKVTGAGAGTPGMLEGGVSASRSAVLSTQEARHLASTRLLLTLYAFFDLARAGKLTESFDELERTGIVPTRRADLDRCVEASRSLDDAVSRNLPDILLAAMDAIYTLYQQHSSTGQGGELAQRHLEELREKARVLITFSGMIQYRLPGDCHARLVRMEVFMH